MKTVHKIIFFLAVLLQASWSVGVSEHSDRAAADLQWLASRRDSLGRDSREYLLCAIDLAQAYSDTAFHEHYKDLALLLCQANGAMRREFGAGSILYRNAMVALHSSLVLGKYEDAQHYQQYAPGAIKALTALERLLPKAQGNREQFLAMLSSAHQAAGHFKKSLKFARERLDLAQGRSADDPRNYAYALGLYLDALDRGGNAEDVPKAFSGAFAQLDAMPDEAQEILRFHLAHDLPLSLPDETWLEVIRRCIRNKEYTTSFNATAKLAQAGRYAPLLELEPVVASQSPEKAIEFFTCWGNILMSLGGAEEGAAHFHERAAIMADSIGREDLIFPDESKFNIWFKAAIDYNNLHKWEKAIEAQREAVSHTRRHFGKGSSEWFAAMEYLSGLVSQYRGDYAEVIRLADEMIGAIGPDTRGGDSLRTAWTLGKMASLRMGHQPGKAAQLGRELLEDTARLSRGQRFGLFNQLGLALAHESLWGPALQALDEAAHVAVTPGDRFAALRNKASVCRDMGNMTQSRDILTALAGEVEREGSDFDKFSHYEELSLSEPDNAKALRLLEKAEGWMTDRVTRNETRA